MHNPRVSVLLPVFDAASTLEACLESLARQTIADYEVVAVDDGSSDGSSEILRRRERSDPRIRLLSRDHVGLVSALNDGLAQCRSPLVARMDADDIAHPRRLERQVGLLEERSDLDVASCLIRCFPRHDVAEGFRLYEGWLNGLVDGESMARERFVESPLAHPSAVFRRETVEKCGGYRDRGWAEDYDLWLRLFEEGAQFAKVAEYLLFWREGGARLSRTDTRYSTRSFLRCKAHFLARGPVAPPEQVVVWGAGITGRRLIRSLLEEGVRIVAVIDIDERKIGRKLRELPIISPDSLNEHLAAGAKVITAVASRGARELIRSRLRRIGLAEGEDFWCAA